MATDPASAAAATSDNYTIDGMNIFWVLFVLTCASAIHPLGSAPGYPPPFARNLRTLPLCSLFDAALLYHDLFLLSFQNGIPLRGAARRLATKRIRQTIPALYGGRRDEDEEDRFFQTLIGILYLDFWPRALANVAVVLIYTKICGFGNVRLSHAIATICFVGWVAMEGFLYLAFGFRVMAKERRLAGYHHHTGDEAVPFNSKRQKVLQSAIGVLVVGQLAVLLWAVISAALPRQYVASDSLPAGQPPQAESTTGLTIWSFLSKWMEIATTPATSWTYTALSKGMNFLLGLAPPERTWLLVIVVPVTLFYITVTITWVGSFAVLVAVFLGLFVPLFVLIVGGVCVVSLGVSLYLLVVRFVGWASHLGTECWLVIAQLGVLSLLLGSLLFYNLLWDGTGTWKEDWTGKLD